MQWTKLTVTVLAASLLTGCAETKVLGDAATGAKPVALARVASTIIGADRDYTAILSADAQTDLSFRVSGYVTEIIRTKGPDGQLRTIESGMPVAAGTVLARIRTSEYQAVVDRAKGGLAESEAGIESAKRQLEQAQAAANQSELDFARMEMLWRQESITKPAYDGALAKRDVARAGVGAAEAGVVAAKRRAEAAGAQVREAQTALADTELIAPYAGVILERRIERGSLVAAGVPVFTLADLRRMKVKLNVPDSEVGRFRAGQALPVKLTAFAGETLRGRVLSIARAADAKSRSFEIQLLLDNPRHRLSAGMIATVTTPSGAPEAALAAPASAVVHDPVSGRDHIFVARLEQSKLVARFTPVEVSNAGSAEVRIIRGDIDAGDRVVVSGAMLLHDGDAIAEAKQ